MLDAALGRLLFPAISAAAILIALGWQSVLRRWAALPALGLLALSIVALPLWLIPAYAPPALLSEAALAAQPGDPSMCAMATWRVWWRLAVPYSPWPRPGDEPAMLLCWQPLSQDDRPLMILVQMSEQRIRVAADPANAAGFGFISHQHVAAWGVLLRRHPRRATGRFTRAGHVSGGSEHHCEHTQQRLPAYAPDGTQLTTNFVAPIKIAPESIRLRRLRTP